MGIDIIKPTNNSKSKSEYVIIFRCNKYDNLEKYKNHPFEMSGYKKVGNSQKPMMMIKKTNRARILVYSISKRRFIICESLNPPPRYQMAIVTIPDISIPLLTLVPQIHVLTEILLIPYAIRLVIGITITVLLMTYVTMPLLTRILKYWLFKS